MSREIQTDVLVVGAGPVGLFTALTLADRGLHVHIIDEEWRGSGRSYALALHPNTLRLFQQFGLAEELIRKGHPLYAQAFYEGPRRIGQLSFSDLPVEFPMALVVSQQTLENALAEKLKTRKVNVEWNHRLADLELDGEQALARVERLGKDSTGYIVTETGWIVEKSESYRAAFVIGADGHRSLVRRRLEIKYQDLGEIGLFAVFEFVSDKEPEHEVRVVMDETKTSVLWPMSDHRFRWSFQLADTDELPEPRAKKRLSVASPSDFSRLGKDRLVRLISERAPWFDASIGDLSWSVAVRFKRRLVRSFGRKNVWLVGDAAHLASPIGVQSMNVGIREGHELAVQIASGLKRGDPFSELIGARASQTIETLENEYNPKRLEEWKRLLDPGSHLEGGKTWFQRHGARILPCIPASGSELKLLARQIGLDTETPKTAPLAPPRR